MTGPDARDTALAHLRRTLPPATAIGFATTPWYWSPPILPEFTAPVPGSVRRRMILDARAPYDLRLPGPDREWDMSVLDDRAPEAVVISDLESQDAYRTAHAGALAFRRALADRYDKAVFGARPMIFGVQVVGDGHLPVDLLYVCPTVTIYRHRGGSQAVGPR
ncbi:MAG: hypothetical protein FJX72_13735 [Armatimonadetes bacterium]|nr:hypothetical protein [Armatimonadota bacterium]